MEKRSPNVPNAFTLTELLVVIAIAAVLVSLLIPGIFKAVYIAHRAKSTSNLRSMGGALMSYSADHGGLLPEGAFRPSLNGSRVRYWYNALDLYFGGSDYTTEGSKREKRPAWQNEPLKVFRNPVWDAGFAVNVGYGWNHSYFGYTADWFPEKTGWASRLSEVDKPSQTIIIGTSVDGTNKTLENLLIYPNTNNAARRYEGKGIYLLLDGHVSLYSPEEIMANGNYLFLKRKPN